MAALVCCGLSFSGAATQSDGDWSDIHGGSAGWHYSALREITTRNVGRLRVAWSHSPDLQTEGLRSTPVAADGLIAYCSGSDDVWVLDGATGHLRWHIHVGVPAEPPATRPAAVSGMAPAAAPSPAGGAVAPPCRGLALVEGNLYFAGAGGRVLSWNATSGALRWEATVLPRDGTHGVLSGPPWVIGDRVIVGSLVSVPGERGVLLGLDSRTGHEMWRIDLAGGPAGHWDAHSTWGQGSGPASGASAWMPGAYDSSNRQLYWGTGSPMPLFDWAGSDWKTHGPHPGNNLYTAGLLGLDPQTGALRAWHQELPHETWVQDSAVSEVLLISRGGKQYVVHPNRSGLVFVYGPDLALQRVWQASKGLNFAQVVDPVTGTLKGRLDFNHEDQSAVCPGVEGAFPGMPGAYSPVTGLWYKVSAAWCMNVRVDSPSPSLARTRPAGSAPEAADKAGASISPVIAGESGASPDAGNSLLRSALGGVATPIPPAGEPAHGRLDARNPLTGAKIWALEFPEPPMASLLATGGGLLFVADGRGTLQALDGGTGRRLWNFKDSDGHDGGLISYQAGGHQYVAVVSGWDANAHPALGRLFGPPYNNDHTPHATLRAFRLP